MRRPLLCAVAALSLVAVLAPGIAAGTGKGSSGAVLPAASNAWGAPLVTWQERWFAWSAGSSANPAVTDTCGERIGNVFFLNSTVDLGTKHVQCRLRSGTRLLGLVSASLVYPTTPEETDEELLAELDSFFDPEAERPRATLDGRSLARAVEASLRYTDVYTIPLEPGNFLASVDPALVEADETRLASAGWLLRLRPLPPGRHLLVFSNQIADVGKLEIKFHITVGRTGCKAHLSRCGHP